MCKPGKLTIKDAETKRSRSSALVPESWLPEAADENQLTQTSSSPESCPVPLSRPESLKKSLTADTSTVVKPVDTSYNFAQIDSEVLVREYRRD